MPAPDPTGPGLTPAELESALRRTGALLEGHFLLSSGLHSSRYIQCARLLQHPDLAERAGRALAREFSGCEKPAAVLSPALGGVIIGHEVARALGVRAIFGERDGAELALRRGFEIEPGEPLLLIEDVVTTGKSVGELAALAERRGGRVVGVGAMVDRSGGELTSGFGHAVTVRALLALDVPRYAPGDCPGCRSGTPAVKPGSRPISEPPKNT